MNQTTLKIALAGLMHDIGKFAQGSIDISRQYANDNADQYQPFYDNRHTHIHALYTAAFIEQFEKKLPHQFNEPGWGEGDSFINLAAGHHKPETAMEWIVTMADRISSGLDRATFDQGEKIAFRDFKKTRLLPLFEGLDPERTSDDGNRPIKDSPDDFQYRYPLAALSAGTIFPLPRNADSLRGDPAREYQNLFDVFISQLDKLLDRESDVELWAHHFDSLLQTCTAMIPAARVGDVIHDVSLYDHARTTAAFASALYGYHCHSKTMDEKSIRDANQEKFLLVTGDFYGIQNFIFSVGGEMKKYRSKLLRGRSFAVSLFSELAADMLCRELGLSFLSVVFNIAGKFTLLAPNTDSSKEKIRTVANRINDWLFEVSCGQASMGIAVTPASPARFYCNEYGKLHDLHIRDALEVKKQKLDLEKYGGPMEGYLESFDASLDKPLCSLCGKRPATAEASGDHSVLGQSAVSACPVCRDHVMLGTSLVRKNRLVVIDSEEASSKGLRKPIFGRYQLRFLNSEAAGLQDERILKMWQVSANPDGTLFTEVTMRPLNGYIPLYTEQDEQDDRLLDSNRSEEKTLELVDQIHAGDPKTFTHIAAAAKVKAEGRESSGTEAIGVLKADVDNLGLLMGCGLPEKQFTMSRMATLSRQLDAFFSVYLPTLLAGHDEFKDIYTVFAGGDDLFLIGPWNRMAYLAAYLQKRFTEYVCTNRAITFSAGITLHKSHVPVDKLAVAAEEALEQSKDAEGKNSVTMFGQTVNWQDFKALLENRVAMQSWLDNKLISNVMMYRFNQLISMAGKEKAALEQTGGEVFLEDLDALKWRAMFSYSIQRNINSSLKGEERTRAVGEVSRMAGWMDKYGAATRIPLWHLLYDKR